MGTNGTIGRSPSSGGVRAEMVYLRDLDVTPVTYYTTGEDLPRRVGNYARFEVTVQDARRHTQDLALDNQGFELLSCQTVVTDFHADDIITDVYYRETKDLLEELTGASEFLVFDHTIRLDRSQVAGELGHRAPVQLVHNDYTVQSGPARVRDLLDAHDTERWLSGRVVEVNVWRPTRGPVRSMPLGVCDAGSVAPADLARVDLVYPQRTGEIYHAVYNADHRWFYFPEMVPDEALVFQCYDSAADGRARFTLHTAFELPGPPPDTPPRESIEVRALLYFES